LPVIEARRFAIALMGADLIQRSSMCDFQLSSVFTLVTQICSATFPLLLPLPSILCRLYTCASKYISLEFDTSSLSKQVLMNRKHFPDLKPWGNATLGSLMARSNDFPPLMPKFDRTPLFHLFLCSLGWCSYILMSCLSLLFLSLLARLGHFRSFQRCRSHVFLAFHLEVFSSRRDLPF